MTALDTVKLAITRLDRFDEPMEIAADDSSISFVAESFVRITRWGSRFLYVFSVDGEMIGVERELASGDGEDDAPDEWDVYPVRAVPATTYVRVPG